MLIRKIWDQTMFGLVKCSDWQNLNFRGRKEVKKGKKRVTEVSKETKKGRKEKKKMKETKK